MEKILNVIPLFLILMLIFVMGSCNFIKKNRKSDKNCVTETIETLQKAAEQNRILFGQQDFAFYGVNWSYEPGRSDVKDVCDDYPAVLGCDLGGLELGGDKNLDGVPFADMQKEIKNHHGRGGLITISWHANNPVTGGNAWDISDKTVVKSILPGGDKHALFCNWLDKVANFLNSLTTDDGKKIPVIFRPWHEHMGSWFWWGRDICSIDEYKSLWQMTTDYLKNKQVDNILLAYSSSMVENEEQYLERYPGDEIIDLLGADPYHPGKEKTEIYIKDLDTILGIMSSVGKKHNKPFALTETGLEAIPIPDWWTNILYKTISKYPVSYVLVWRNANENQHQGHYYAPYPGQVSESDFITFSKLPLMVFAKNMGKLK